MQQIINQCRCCGSEDIQLIHDFGSVPIADQLTDKIEQLEVFPLSVVFCKDCFHLQLRENVDPQILFQNSYPYYSSLIPEVVEHFKSTYQSITEKVQIDSKDSILEIASNDGVLISQFIANTEKLFAVEPSSEHAEITNNNRITTYNEFFNFTLTEKLVQDINPKPKLIMACNVLAHVPDPDDFVKGLANLADENTAIVIEVPHSLPMIQNGTFDVIFHQHFSFFNITTLQKLFLKHHLIINQVEEIDTQGGGMRLFISRKIMLDKSVNVFQRNENENMLYDVETYFKFSGRIKKLKSDTLELLLKIKKDNKSIVGYGAPGKAATFLNYIGINHSVFDCLIDISPTKHYKYFPNTELQILPLSYLENNHADYVFILTWNYADTVMSNLQFMKKRGTQFIIPYSIITII